jgi:serine phosphatase RsbU (regulator of sigma subunit)
MQAAIEHIQVEATEKAVAMKERIKITLMVVMLLCVILNVMLSLFISRYLSRPVRQLSHSIHQVIKNNFAQDLPIERINTSDEIGWLSNDFSIMVRTVQLHISKIKEQAAHIAKAQNQTLDSIRYGQQIQNAILPTVEELNAYFSDSFVLYRPQKLVSGDFYWLYRKKKRTFLAVVDCTGHGVPGAFMSMIGHTLLTKIVGQNKIYDPATILELLHLEIKNALHQNQGKNDDGMDIALLAIEEMASNQFSLIFAGAKRPLYYVDRGTFKMLKGNNRSIGGRQKSENKPFENQEVKLKKGDTIYLTTDGFADQNNAQREKFGTIQVETLLAQVHRQTLPKQLEILQRTLEAHKKQEPQRDDITIVGVKI